MNNVNYIKMSVDTLKLDLEKILKEAGDKQLNLNSQATRDYLIKSIIERVYIVV